MPVTKLKQEKKKIGKKALLIFWLSAGAIKLNNTNKQKGVDRVRPDSSPILRMLLKPSKGLSMFSEL